MIADRDLFAIVQLAILEAETECGPLGLSNGANRTELLEHLRIDDSTLKRLRGVKYVQAVPPESGLDANPHRVPLVRNLLRLAGESRRRNGPGLVVRLEEQIDGLHRLVADLGDQAGVRLRDAKLAGLAELAAGAGHEINNPLAIISTNAQRCCELSPTPTVANPCMPLFDRLTASRACFATSCNSPARLSQVPASSRLRSCWRSYATICYRWRPNRACDWNCKARRDLWINGDKDQLRHALGAVIRNGIEAAGTDGWVRLSCPVIGDGNLAIACEDSGPGLTAEAIEHAFDPFYCGRVAGRGRGLGLSTAWQLVRQNGGDLLLADA